MRTAVVCDDDDVLRSVIRELAEEQGLHVVAETDHGMDVVELVRRFDIDVVVLDLALPDVPGETVLHHLHDDGLDPHVIVYTAFDHEDPALRALGVRTSIQKPDLETLAGALSAAAEGALPDSPVPGGPETGGGAGVERRAPHREVQLPASLWRSPSGVEPAHTLDGQLETCSAGDTLVAIAPDDLDGLVARYGRLLAHDCLLELARRTRAAIRAQDSIVEEPACDGFLVVLRAGDARTASAAWRRIQHRLEGARTDVTIRAAWTLVGDSVTEARARVVGSVQGMPPGSFEPA